MRRLLRGEEFLNPICNGIELSGWTPIILQRTHPFKVTATKEGNKPQTMLIYIWNLSPGGPIGVRPRGEYRIQLTGITPPLERKPEFETLLLGWSEEHQVFAGFEVQRHINFSPRSPSIQIREEALEEASQQGFAFHNRTNREIAIAFTPDQFMNYALQQRPLYLFRNPLQVEILQASSRGQEPELEDVPSERREIVTTISQLSRDRSFRTRVLKAYNYSCTICGTQLGLIEAAHIIPVGAEGSNDSVRNGLALCPTHHDAYDKKKLIGVKSDYHIIVNNQKIFELERARLTKGIETLLNSFVSQTILLPSDPQSFPPPEYLTQGLRIRGWQI